MRSYAGEQSYTLETIGTADDTIDPDGMTIRRSRRLRLSPGSVSSRVSGWSRIPACGRGLHRQGCYRRLPRLEEQNRKSARDTRWRADALIPPALGGTACSKLTTKMLRDWHKGLPKVAPRLRTQKGAPQRFSEIETDDPTEAARRRRSTANRTLTILKAALNHAWREEKVASDAAWRPVTAFKEADAAREASHGSRGSAPHECGGRWPREAGAGCARDRRSLRRIGCRNSWGTLTRTGRNTPHPHQQERQGQAYRADRRRLDLLWCTFGGPVAPGPTATQGGWHELHSPGRYARARHMASSGRPGPPAQYSVCCHNDLRDSVAIPRKRYI